MVLKLELRIYLHKLRSILMKGVTNKIGRIDISQERRHTGDKRRVIRNSKGTNE